MPGFAHAQVRLMTPTTPVALVGLGPVEGPAGPAGSRVAAGTDAGDGATAAGGVSAPVGSPPSLLGVCGGAWQEKAAGPAAYPGKGAAIGTEAGADIGAGGVREGVGCSNVADRRCLTLVQLPLSDGSERTECRLLAEGGEQLSLLGERMVAAAAKAAMPPE
mmetsp:Transcript_103669/g.293014  ORF Transcript_103669/g.293014 Transcript_103669/m.293014 type:complete len:162 (+) Transcript_103669:91-576(+)